MCESMLITFALNLGVNRYLAILVTFLHLSLFQLHERFEYDSARVLPHSSGSASPILKSHSVFK